MGSMSADVVCVCLVCIMWQFSRLHSACWLRMEETYSRAGLMTAI